MSQEERVSFRSPHVKQEDEISSYCEISSVEKSSSTKEGRELKSPRKTFDHDASATGQNIKLSKFPLEIQKNLEKARKLRVKRLKRAIKDETIKRRLILECNKADARIKSRIEHKLYPDTRIHKDAEDKIRWNDKKQETVDYGNVAESIVEEAHNFTGASNASCSLEKVCSFNNDSKKHRLDDFHHLKTSMHTSKSHHQSDHSEWSNHLLKKHTTNAIYKKMPIDEIDDLVGWATSHMGNALRARLLSNDAKVLSMYDEVEFSNLHHMSMPPPPPSHVAFLHQHLQKRLLNQITLMKSSNSNNDVKSQLTHNLCGNIDTSALVCIGMAVEELMTLALIPLAKAHVERCRRLDRKKINIAKFQKAHDCLNQSSSDPFVAWTLPAQEAVVELANDHHIQQHSCYLPSTMPPSRIFHSRKIEGFNGRKIENGALKSDNPNPFLLWCRMQELNPDSLRHDEEYNNLLCLFCQSGIMKELCKIKQEDIVAEKSRGTSS